MRLRCRHQCSLSNEWEQHGICTNHLLSFEKLHNRRMQNLLTLDRVQERIGTLTNNNDFHTQRFIETWGRGHQAQTLAWFRQVAADDSYASRQVRRQPTGEALTCQSCWHGLHRQSRRASWQRSGRQGQRRNRNTVRQARWPWSAAREDRQSPRRSG